jgi:hypothetical protein
MDKEFYGKISGYCRKCGSANLIYYTGMLGYESIVCQDCNTHHTNVEPIIPEENSK